jgi:hypothetical protein
VRLIFALNPGGGELLAGLPFRRARFLLFRFCIVFLCILIAMSITRESPSGEFCRLPTLEKFFAVGKLCGALGRGILPNGRSLLAGVQPSLYLPPPFR